MKKGLIFALAFLLIIPAVSASLTISQPNSLYTFGDSIAINISVSEQVATNQYLSVSLMCGSDGLNLYRAPLSLNAGESKQVYFEALIDADVFNNVQGSCMLKASYANETSQSSSFRISNNANVYVHTTENVFEPSESINVYGTASRENGESINGNAQAFILGTNLSVSSDVVNGSFNMSIGIPSDMPSGSYVVQVNAYDSNSAGAVLNSGSGSANIRVKQVISAMDIALGSPSISPGNSSDYNIILYDQAYSKANDQLSVSIYRPDGSIYEQKVVQSGEDEIFSTETNFSSGYWTIYASDGKVNASRQVYVQEYYAIKTSIENSTLIVENIGNMPYNKPLSISLGNTNEVVQLKVPVNGIQQLHLSAPDGKYAINVYDGILNNTFSDVSLTGNAIAVTDLSSGSSTLNWIWSILIVIGIALIVYMYRRVSKERGYGMRDVIPRFDNKERKEEVAKVRLIGAQIKTGNVGGSKKEVAVIAMRIKNYDELARVKSPAMDTIHKAIRIAKESKAVVMNGSPSTMMYFSDVSVKEQNITLAAAKVAKQIEEMFKSHNRKYAQKIVFGIGVHIDTFIVENSAGSWHFTPLGTAGSYVRKMADNASDTALMSDAAHEKTRAEIKVDKDIGGLFWSIRSFNARSSEHEEFIKRFLSKSKFEEK